LQNQLEHINDNLHNRQGSDGNGNRFGFTMGSGQNFGSGNNSVMEPIVMDF
jgi:hypothetical protein